MTTYSDSKRFSQALRSAILWPVCVIFFTAILLLAMIFGLMRVVKWSEHSYAVLSHARVCEDKIGDAHATLRSYLLTGDKTFPATFDRQRADAAQAMAYLRRLVRENPPQVARVDEMIQTNDIWFEQANSVAQNVAKGAPVNSDWARLSGSLIDRLRGQFRTFTSVEEKLHDTREEQVQRTKNFLVIAGGVMVLSLMVTVGLLVWRQFLGLAVDYGSALGTIEQRHAALVRSEADLEEQKEWFRVTLSSIGDGVIVTDQEGRIVFMNHESERLTGWNSVEALLKPASTVFRLIDEITRAKLEDPVDVVFRDKHGTGISPRAVLLARNGEEWPIEDSAAPIRDSKGRMLGVVIVFHNATDIRKAQTALRIHSEELEKRVAERTTALQQSVTELESFSYTVSHDLRSPLRAMQGFAQAVLEDYGEKLDDQGRHYLDRIKNAAERLDRLIQDLLSYTRITRQDAPLVPLDMDKLLHEMLENYPNLHPPAAEVKVEGKLPAILGHEASLTQVLSNLLGNAVKFVPPSTQPQVRVWAEEHDDYVRLLIQDNGIGIPESDHDRIFKMFVQVNESRLYGGTGVGLAIVAKAVESMQGRVGVESPEEGGTRFWVELLRAPPAEATAGASGMRKSGPVAKAIA